MHRVTVVLLSLMLFVEGADLPKFLQNLRCSIKKDFDACFIKNANLAIPEVTKGVPEVGIPKLNPLELDFIQLVSTPNLSLNLTKLKLHGLENLRIVSSRPGFSEGFSTATLKGGNLTLEGRYDVDGKIMVMPLKGKGNFKIFLKNPVFKLTITFGIIKINDESYSKPSPSRIEHHFDKIVFDFENLFDGNKELGDQVNKFLNENWDLLIVDFGPGISKTVSAVFDDIYIKFAAAVPLEKVFLDFGGV